MKTSRTILITGATGMVGKGVLLECLDSPVVSQVILVSRSSVGFSHPKIKEILLSDLTRISEKAEEIPQLDAVFFCMGVSAVGMDEAKYTSLTFDPVKAFADLIFNQSPQACFIYVSGAGTDSSEKGSMMWARVKGRTENYVLKKGFRNAYAFRPGVIIPEKGVQAKVPWYNTAYKILRPFFSLMKKSKSITTTTRIGQAMLSVMGKGFPKTHLGNTEINEIAQNQ